MIPKLSLLDAASQQGNEITAAGPKQDGKLWITCFGFLPGQGSVILDYFSSKRGIIITDFQPKDDNSSNWIHLKLKTQKDVAVALGESGQVLDLNGTKIMIGVAVYLEGDQLPSKAEPAKPLGHPLPGVAGPRRSSSLWEKAAVWVFDM
jgi:hypothetical protein